jgi:hypothetical protein
MTARQARRACRRMGHPVSLKIYTLDDTVIEVCHCAQRDGLFRYYAVAP